MTATSRSGPSRRIWRTASTPPRESLSGLPPSRVWRSARSSRAARSRPAPAFSAEARSPALVRSQAGWAARAASTRVSASDQGSRPTISPLAGSCTMSSGMAPAFPEPSAATLVRPPFPGRPRVWLGCSSRPNPGHDCRPLVGGPPLRHRRRSQRAEERRRPLGSVRLGNVISWSAVENLFTARSENVRLV